MEQVRLRVLQVTQYMDIGGLEALVVELSSQLRNRGVDVELLCLNDIDEKYVSTLREKNIPIHIIKGKGRFDLDFYRRAINFISKKNFDVIHAHSGCHLNAAIFRKFSGVNKFIFTVHGIPIFKRLHDRIEDAIAAYMTDEIISVSHEIDSFMQNWLFSSHRKFRTIINGIDTNKFRPYEKSASKKSFLEKYSLPEDRVLFGSVGRLDTVKNYSMALHAVRRIVDAGIKNIGFVLVGRGPVVHEQYLLDIVEELGISDYVYFLGMQYSIHEILPLFRFFVLSSLTEGTSISLLESQACGLPAVVTDVGGNSNVISHGVNGFLCNLDDDKKMAEYMLKLVENPHLAEEMGMTGRKKVKEDFGIETMTEKYLQLLT